MNKKLIVVFIVMALMVGACSFGTISFNTVVGSGKVSSETRRVSGFISIVLKGATNVDVAFGNSESVVVEADDNIVPLVETVVQNGQLVIRAQSNASFITRNSIRVRVTMKSLKGVTLKGSGNITVSGLSGDGLIVDLPGSGNFTVTGAADAVQISLPGSGNIYCIGLKAKSAKVTLNGSGNIMVYASQSLDANIRGSGTIRYDGNPAQVSKSVTGSGSITPWG
jgi:hypothetical protein